MKYLTLGKNLTYDINNHTLLIRNIQIASNTHSNKSHKRKICVKHLTHNNYHCNEKRSNKPSIRNTIQNYGNYKINYIHDKYRKSDNYINDNYNCNYNYYKDYHKGRMKKQSTAVYIGLKQTEHTQCIHDERIMEHAERRERSVCKAKQRGDSVWPRGRMKFVHYRQVSYTVKTNVHAVNTHNKGMQDGNVTWRVMLQRNNEFPVDDGQCIVNLERGGNQTTPHSMLYCNE